jgi:hypothetical protein
MSAPAAPGVVPTPLVDGSDNTATLGASTKRLLQRVSIRVEERQFELEWCLCKDVGGLETHIESHFEAVAVTERLRRTSLHYEARQFEREKRRFEIELWPSAAVDTPFHPGSPQDEDTG